jgi:phage recombination protein Bet
MAKKKQKSSNKVEVVKKVYTVDKLDLQIWEDKNLNDIKRVYKSDLINDAEFSVFLQLGKATGLNPFLKEIWCIKYDLSKAAQIFISRDGCMRIAQRHPDFRGCNSYPIYANDILYISAETHVTHKPALFKDRGELLGAFCVVHRAGFPDKIISVNFPDYDTKQSLWRTKKETMIKKVAEAQALRSAFCELFQGTYFEEEVPEEMTRDYNQKTKSFGVDKLKQAINVPANNKVNDEQLAYISSLIIETQCPQERIVKALDVYNVKSFDEVTEKQAQHFISMLEKIKAS